MKRQFHSYGFDNLRHAGQCLPPRQIFAIARDGHAPPLDFQNDIEVDCVHLASNEVHLLFWLLTDLLQAGCVQECWSIEKDWFAFCAAWPSSEAGFAWIAIARNRGSTIASTLRYALNLGAFHGEPRTALPWGEFCKLLNIGC